MFSALWRLRRRGRSGPSLAARPGTGLATLGLFSALWRLRRRGRSGPSLAARPGTGLATLGLFPLSGGYAAGAARALPSLLGRVPALATLGSVDMQRRGVRPR